jgi:hypothetical protein
MQAATGRKHAGHLTGSTQPRGTGCETAGPTRVSGARSMPTRWTEALATATASPSLSRASCATFHTLPQKPMVRKWYFQF